MTNGFGETQDKDGNIIRFFHDTTKCKNGEEHEWDDWRDNEDGSSEAVCSKCGMGFMHYAQMTAND